jgi:hypothetical protein
MRGRTKTQPGTSYEQIIKRDKKWGLEEGDETIHTDKQTQLGAIHKKYIRKN